MTKAESFLDGHGSKEDEEDEKAAKMLNSTDLGNATFAEAVNGTQALDAVKDAHTGNEKTAEGHAKRDHGGSHEASEKSGEAELPEVEPVEPHELVHDETDKRK